MISVEQVIYLYIFVCLAMLAFNGLFALSRRASSRGLERKIAQYTGWIGSQVRLLAEGEPLSEKLQNRMAARMRHSRELMAFHGAVSKLREQEPVLIQSYLEKSKPLFLGLAVEYAKENDMKKAYFAYVISQYRLEQGMSHSVLGQLLERFCVSPNAYCRENALKALYSLGNPELVASAVIRIDQMGIHHHNKLLSDGLASFTGDHERLCALLWKQYPRMSQQMRLVFINYVRQVSGNYQAQFYELLSNPVTHKEIHLAVLRYFRNYHYEPAYPLLLDDVGRDDTDWEYAAVAALALRNYPGENTARALKRALSSSNWYVRYNAAESLLALGLSPQDRQEIYHGGDRYAQEMLDFHTEKFQRQKEETASWKP